MAARASERCKYGDTTATRNVFAMRKRIRAVSGGTGASKTTSILIWLIDYAQNTKSDLVSIVSESFPHLRKGALRDFKAIMQDRDYWDEECWSETTHEYRFGSGSVIEFFSADTYGKAHGPRRDVLFINECNNVPWDIADQLITRTRKVVWLDWNPTSSFWYYERMELRDDVSALTLTFRDNEALDSGSREEIFAHRDDRRWWDVYADGKLGELGNCIYTGWKIIDGVPPEARLVGYGLDFGYSRDPTALVALYYLDGGLIVDEVLFQKGLSNQQIAEVLKSLPDALVVADSAEPKSIDEIRRYGVSIIPTTKGKGSVSQRIQYTQAQRISVTKQSVNVIKEYRNYMWRSDRNGNVMDEPEHAFSNSMDALSYAIQFLPNHGGRIFASPILERREKVWIDPREMAPDQRLEYYYSNRRRIERPPYETPGLGSPWEIKR